MSTQGELMVRTLPITALAQEEGKRIAELSTADLRQELALALELTARSLLRLALIVRTLEDRGEDVSDLRLPLLTYLRKIATGQLLPELVARFAECPGIIRKATKFSIREQTTLASGEGVLLVVRGNGQWTHRKADPTKMQKDQLHQVLASDHLRTESEQILWLEAKKVPEAQPVTRKHGIAQADSRRNGVVIGKKFVPLSDLIGALTDLAAATDSSVSEQVKKAMRAARLI